METEIKKPIRLIDWLVDKELFLKYWTEEEVIKALYQTGLTTKELTEIQDEFHPPNYGIFEDLGTKREMKTRHKMSFGCEIEYQEICTVWKVRRPRHYQTLEHHKLLRNLFYLRFPWFPKFSWNIYHLDTHSEIYLNTEKGSLYVPVDALLARDITAIKTRMTTYAHQYTHMGTYPGGEEANTKTVRTERELEMVAPLESEEAKKFFSLLEGK